MKKFIFMALAVLTMSLASCSDSAKKTDDASVTIENLQSQLASGDASGIQATLETVKTKIAELVAKDPEAAKTYVAKVQEFLKENVEKVNALVGDNAMAQGLVSTIVNTPAETVVQTLTAGQNILDNAQETLEGTADELQQAAEDKANEVLDDVNAKIEEGQEKVNKAVNDATDKVNDAINEGADKLMKGAGLK